MCIAVAIELDPFYQYMSEEAEEEHKNLQNFHSTGLLNLGPPEHEAGVLTPHP